MEGKISLLKTISNIQDSLRIYGNKDVYSLNKPTRKKYLLKIFKMPY